MNDTISRQAAIDALDCINGVEEVLRSLPTVQPEIHFDEWCVDCKEYDHDKHCCPRFNKVIRRTVEELKAQPKTGKWIFGHTLGHSWMKCSECLVSQDGQTACFSYCPNCGAKMEGD